MKLYHLSSGPLNVNSYFLVNENTNNAIVIDSGENYNLIKRTENDLNIKIKAVLLTHAHFDHAGNAKKLQDDGAKIYISKKDAPKLLNDDNLAGNFGRHFDYVKADYVFCGEKELEVEGVKIRVLETPGHTDGSVTFMVDNMLFTGDTLFHDSVGRTDFVSGSREDIILSVKKLFALKGSYNVYPGHDEFTTLDYERENNKFIDYD